MGHKQSKKIDVTDFDQGQWNMIGIHRDIIHVVQSIKGRGQAQQQIIPLDQKLDLQKEIEIYQYRKDQNNALVKCLGVSVQKTKSKTICGMNQSINVLTQRIPLRLNQLPQLSFPQSLYTLSEALRGYQVCYDKLGPFEITPQMIGINNDGEIKVWVNDDFGENHPNAEKPMLLTSGMVKQEQIVQQLIGKKDEAAMVQNITKLVERKCQSGKFPQDFVDKINKTPLGFDKMFLVIQQYSKQKKLFIPDRIMNMNIDYNKVKYFTPGDQYERNQNDPNYRRKHPFSPQNIQPLQSGRPGNTDSEYENRDITILRNANKSNKDYEGRDITILGGRGNRIQSPIHNLIEGDRIEVPNQDQRFNEQYSHQTRSNMTFN